jgi:hypothetical protein
MEDEMKNAIMKRIEKPQELNPEPGEDPRIWMARNAQYWLLEIEKIAMNPEASLKTRLDALRELVGKILPPTSVSELKTVSPERERIRHMSNEEIKELIVEKLGGPKEARQIISEIEKKRKLQERKDARSKKTLSLEYKSGN